MLVANGNDMLLLASKQHSWCSWILAGWSILSVFTVINSLKWNRYKFSWLAGSSPASLTLQLLSQSKTHLKGTFPVGFLSRQKSKRAIITFCRTLKPHSCSTCLFLTFATPKWPQGGQNWGRGRTEESSADGGNTEQRCSGEEHKSSENLEVNML